MTTIFLQTPRDSTRNKNTKQSNNFCLDFICGKNHIQTYCIWLRNTIITYDDCISLKNESKHITEFFYQTFAANTRPRIPTPVTSLRLSAFFKSVWFSLSGYCLGTRSLTMFVFRFFHHWLLFTLIIVPMRVDASTLYVHARVDRLTVSMSFTFKI